MTYTEEGFEEHREEAAEAILNATEQLSRVRAYVLAEEELETFKEAHLDLRELSGEFEPYAPEEEIVIHSLPSDEDLGVDRE